jgi:hypothetical protein
LGWHPVGVRDQVDKEDDVRVMMIKGDREPGHLPSEEFLAQIGNYNQELSKAGVLLDLAALHWSAEGVRVKFSAGKRTVIDGPSARPRRSSPATGSSR